MIPAGQIVYFSILILILLRLSILNFIFDFKHWFAVFNISILIKLINIYYYFDKDFNF